MFFSKCFVLWAKLLFCFFFAAAVAWAKKQMCNLCGWIFFQLAGNGRGYGKCGISRHFPFRLAVSLFCVITFILTP